ncbi:type ISP restriction/modification enzyme [Geotalea sp. SG265]|uniref:DEAD/DEAH box helicase n=1 Tax=Geotalea sp. SG265 TaxID=2922867 RepID=UPI001FAF7CC2|nr:type ISP restriction/modification enzyme [Geotalea sp. SG265]
MTTIQSLLEEFRQAATNNRDMGDKFERLIVAYLRSDPIYREWFDEVWLWGEWKLRGNKPDTGIDIVAREKATGDWCAIQCKFYLPDHTLQKSDIDSFFTASGKSPFTSRIIVSTTDRWSKNAEDALEHQQIPVSRLRVQDLADSPIDWSQYSLSRPQDIKLRAKKQLREHQKLALTDVINGFKADDRGKLIMACGTGKTFTALKIAETQAPPQGHILFLVPSISLLSQSLREWTAEATNPLHCYTVCSDTKVGKKSESEDISTCDLAFPATTDARKLARLMESFKPAKDQLTVVFSTYQSIEAVAESQKFGVPEFDLIICDEAHRTTGVTLDGDDESAFVRVHDQNFLKGKKRLYMTATPRIYGDATKTKAEEADATLCSMDDEKLYGKEFHRLGFSKAVGDGLLSDYKVMVLAVDEKFVSKTFQRQLADSDNELNLDDAVKITGCWNGLSKKMATDADGHALENDSAPMRRAVAFSRSIKDSKKITAMFSQIIEEYALKHQDDDIEILRCEVDHVDGTFNALARNKMLDWLKEETTGNTCRILSNARCLSEGVDVPALDAVLFLNPRNSVVDVVQSVGRVMRKADNKKYGYIILPIGIPADMAPEEALKDNQKYKVVWQVLQALRAHDDRFNATINQIELNKSRPDQIRVIGVGGGKDDGEDPGSGKDAKGGDGTTKPVQFAFNFPHLEEWRDAIFAKIVIKCGDRRYWESWAKDVAEIAERHVTRIKALLEDSGHQHRLAFDEFLAGLRTNLNPSIDEADAIEMLSQHLITRPVFDALFEGYEFTQQNPVSLSMQKMLDLLERQALEKETTSLEKFYTSVKERARGIDNAAGKQTIIKELYDKFFNTAFPRMAERLGIVYTPVEVVDFIIKSVDDALRQEFGVNVATKGVHILDPFTGTATFIVRLLQSGLIKPEDLPYKYKNELHANEIVLLAYYVAAINIEETYHSITGGDYQPFEGIVLTDTFQLSEQRDPIPHKDFPENSERANRQNKTDIRVIIGNPPYSAGQTSENDANKNLKYPQLDARIRGTYAEHSTATNKNSLYDSYIRSFRWASDRIKDKGIVCYVSNGSFIDGNAMDGLRKCLTDEFTSIYCFNLRGNQRTSGETSRMEGGKIFGSGSRASIAITLLIKNPEKQGNCKLFYHDIGDYLSREEKLKIITAFGGIKGIHWKQLQPNSSHDWINQRDPAFERFLPLGDKEDKTAQTIFGTYSGGLKTNRDTWAYNSSKQNLTQNMSGMAEFYNEQVKAYQEYCGRVEKGKRLEVEKFIDNNPQRISWSRGLKNDLERFINRDFKPSSVVSGMYRPYFKQWAYFDKYFNDMVYQMPKFFPNNDTKNLIISICGVGVTKEFSVIITDCLPDVQLQANGQCFPLYAYVKNEIAGGLFDTATSGEYIRKDNLTDYILKEFRTVYGAKVGKEDIFFYVYGVLHSPEYKRRFEADLKKMLPRIPLVKDFWAFSEAGRKLAKWHLDYETVEPYKLQESSNALDLDPKNHFKVSKMTFTKKGKDVDKSTIIYNSNVVLTGIPLEAYEYIVNGKSAIEWIMERYQVTKDKDSQIINDPNHWSSDPRYIIDLVKRIVTVSMETMKIIKGLPPLEETN